MWTLAIFADRILYVCRKKHVSIYRSTCAVKYSDNRKYAARVIALCHEKSVLESLKAHLEGEGRSISDGWKLDGTETLNYVTAVQAIETNQDTNIIFVEKCVFSQARTYPHIISFALPESMDFSIFDPKMRQFKKLRRGPSTSIETIDRTTITSAAASFDVKNLEFIVGEKNEDESLQTDQEIPSISNLPTNLKIVIKKLDLDTSSLDVTNSINDKSFDSSLLNCVIAETLETSSQTFIQDQLESSAHCESIGKPTFSSTMEQTPSPLKTIIPTDNEQNKRLLDQSIDEIPSIIESSSIIEMGISIFSELDGKCDVIGMRPIRKPNYAMETPDIFAMDKGAIGKTKTEEILAFTTTDDSVVYESPRERTENYEGHTAEINNLEEIETLSTELKKPVNSQISPRRTNYRDGLLNSSSAPSPSENEDGKGDLRQESTLQEKTFIVEIPEIHQSIENWENSYGASLTSELTSNPIRELQSISQLTKDLENRHETTHEVNPSRPEEETSKISQFTENLEICRKSNPTHELNSSVAGYRSHQFTSKDIQSSKNTPHDYQGEKVKIRPAFSPIVNTNSEMFTPNILKDRKIKKSNSEKKKNFQKKKQVKIIRDEPINVVLTKKRKKVDSMKKHSPNVQNFGNEKDRYNFRKKGRNMDELKSDSEALTSDQSESRATSASADDDQDESQVPKKRRVVFDFNESDYEDDDEEYQPSDPDASNSDDEVEDDNNWKTDDEELEDDVQTEKIFSESLNITIDNNPHSSAADDRELRVDSTSTHAKKHFCMFCHKFQTKLARHLELRHSGEEEVKKFLELPPKNKERQEIITVIRKNGDHVYNTNRQFNNGSLIVCRRSSAGRGKTAEDYIACGNCKGQYSKKVVHHHWRRCTNRNGKYERIVMINGKKISGRLHERANNDVRKHIFPYLREDEVVRKIRYDELLIVFANKQYEKYGTNPHLYQMVRARLRLFGRFIAAITQINPRIKDSMDVFQPRNYDSMIEAVKTVAGFLPETKTFPHPAVASLLGTLLKNLGEVYRSECIKKELVEKKRQAEDFLKLLTEDYGTSINRAVTETQTQHHRRKEVILPNTEDVKKMYNYIVSERCRYLSEVTAEFSFASWKKLAETTLLTLLIFNRRRPGELERLYIQDFHSYLGINDMADKEIYETLSTEGKALANRYVRFEIRGKRNRSVPVLADNDVLECLKAIDNYREAAGVPHTNLYLFGLPSHNKDRHKFLRACNLMREYSEKCGAAIPYLLRGTQLRKHIATRCINLNLEGSQVTDLANFMGHHENVHRQIYRQPVAATDIVKISKILNIVQSVPGHEESSDEEAGTSNTSRLQRSSPQNDSHFESNVSRINGKSFQSNSSRQYDCSTPKRPWDEETRSVVLGAFGRTLANGSMPSSIEMKDFITSNTCMAGRTVAQLRTWLHTQRKKLTNQKNTKRR